MPRVRVLLADDHLVLVAGLKKLLAEEYDVVGSVNNGEKCVAAAARLQPDIAVMDISMPGLSGIEAARKIRAEFPGIRILFLSVHDDPIFVEEAFRAGAQGYVLKQSAPKELFAALQAMAKGATYVSPAVKHELSVRSGRGAHLTLRQIDVLRLVAEGLQNKEIAARLTIDVKTVEYHKGRLMSQLNVHTVAGLTRYAIRKGIVLN